MSSQSRGHLEAIPTCAFSPRLVLISQRSPTPPPPNPGSLGKPEFSDQGPCTPGHHGTQAHPRSTPLARKNSTGLETNIHVLCIIHGSCPGCHIKRRFITQPAHSGDRKCPVQEECGKRGKAGYYPNKLPY